MSVVLWLIQRCRTVFPSVFSRALNALGRMNSALDRRRHRALHIRLRRQSMREFPSSDGFRNASQWGVLGVSVLIGGALRLLAASANLGAGSGFRPLGDNLDQVGAAVSVGCGLLLIVVVFLLIDRFVDRRTASLVVVLLALSPVHILAAMQPFGGSASALIALTAMFVLSTVVAVGPVQDGPRTMHVIVGRRLLFGAVILAFSVSAIVRLIWPEHPAGSLASTREALGIAFDVDPIYAGNTRPSVIAYRIADAWWWASISAMVLGLAVYRRCVGLLAVGAVVAAWLVAIAFGAGLGATIWTSTFAVIGLGIVIERLRRADRAAQADRCPTGLSL